MEVINPIQEDEFSSDKELLMNLFRDGGYYLYYDTAGMIVNDTKMNLGRFGYTLKFPESVKPESITNLLGGLIMHTQLKLLGEFTKEGSAKNLRPHLVAQKNKKKFQTAQLVQERVRQVAEVVSRVIKKMRLYEEYLNPRFTGVSEVTRAQFYTAFSQMLKIEELLAETEFRLVQEFQEEYVRLNADYAEELRKSESILLLSQQSSQRRVRELEYSVKDLKTKIQQEAFKFRNTLEYEILQSQYNKEFYNQSLDATLRERNQLAQENERLLRELADKEQAFVVERTLTEEYKYEVQNLKNLISEQTQKMQEQVRSLKSKEQLSYSLADDVVRSRNELRQLEIQLMEVKTAKKDEFEKFQDSMAQQRVTIDYLTRDLDQLQEMLYKVREDNTLEQNQKDSRISQLGIMIQDLYDSLDQYMKLYEEYNRKFKEIERQLLESQYKRDELERRIAEQQKYIQDMNQYQDIQKLKYEYEMIQMARVNKELIQELNYKFDSLRIQFEDTETMRYRAVIEYQQLREERDLFQNEYAGLQYTIQMQRSEFEIAQQQLRLSEARVRYLREVYELISQIPYSNRVTLGEIRYRLLELEPGIDVNQLVLMQLRIFDLLDSNEEYLARDQIYKNQIRYLDGELVRSIRYQASEKEQIQQEMRSLRAIQEYYEYYRYILLSQSEDALGRRTRLFYIQIEAYKYDIRELYNRLRDRERYFYNLIDTTTRESQYNYESNDMLFQRVLRIQEEYEAMRQDLNQQISIKESVIQDLYNQLEAYRLYLNQEIIQLRNDSIQYEETIRLYTLQLQRKDDELAEYRQQLEETIEIFKKMRSSGSMEYLEKVREEAEGIWSPALEDFYVRQREVVRVVRESSDIARREYDMNRQLTFAQQYLTEQLETQQRMLVESNRLVEDYRLREYEFVRVQDQMFAIENYIREKIMQQQYIENIYAERSNPEQNLLNFRDDLFFFIDQKERLLQEALMKLEDEKKRSLEAAIVQREIFEYEIAEAYNQIALVRERLALEEYGRQLEYREFREAAIRYEAILEQRFREGIPDEEIVRSTSYNIYSILNENPVQARQIVRTMTEESRRQSRYTGINDNLIRTLNLRSLDGFIRETIPLIRNLNGTNAQRIVRNFYVYLFKTRYPRFFPRGPLDDLIQSFVSDSSLALSSSEPSRSYSRSFRGGDPLSSGQDITLGDETRRKQLQKLNIPERALTEEPRARRDSIDIDIFRSVIEKRDELDSINLFEQGLSNILREAGISPAVTDRTSSREYTPRMFNAAGDGGDGGDDEPSDDFYDFYDDAYEDDDDGDDEEDPDPYNPTLISSIEGTLTLDSLGESDFSILDYINSVIERTVTDILETPPATPESSYFYSFSQPSTSRITSGGNNLTDLKSFLIAGIYSLKKKKDKASKIQIQIFKEMLKGINQDLEAAKNKVQADLETYQLISKNI